MAKPMAGTEGGEAPTSPTLPQGRVFGRENYVTDPDLLAEFPRPSEDEVRQQVRSGFTGLRGGSKKL